MKDDPIDWEKLLAYLDANENNMMEDMSDKEIEMLLYAEDVRRKLRGENPNEQFPLVEGIQEFAKRRKKQHFKRILTYAAAVIAIVGIGLWTVVYNQQAIVVDKMTANTSTQSKGIKLRLGNGEEILIDAQAKNLQEQGSEIDIAKNLIRYKEKNVGDKITNLNNLEVPLGMRTKVILADGTQVWLNSGTTMRYPVAFNKDKREVYLDGEAYFDVAHDSKRAFFVHSGDLQVKVLGTAFAVNTLSERIKIALVRGSVDLEINKQVRRLIPGEVGQYNTQTAKLSLSDENIRGLVAWKDNMFFFDDSNLAEITARLGRTYDYEFVFDSPELKTLSFTIDIEQTDDINTILGYLKLSSPKFDFRITGRTIHIMDKK